MRTIQTSSSVAKSLIWTWLILIAAFAGTHGARAAIITSVAETGGDGAPFAQFTGNTFTGPAIGTYTVPVFGAAVKSFADRVHAWTNANATGITRPLPPYLVGQEYIMIRNDNRDNNGGLNGGSAGLYRLDVTVGAPVHVYLLIDNRLNDNNGANPPTFGPTNMNWIITDGWAPKTNGGFNRTANFNVPDEIGIDEGADGSINQYHSVYVKTFLAGTFSLKEANNTGRNMYGAVVAPAFPPAAPLNLTAVGGDSRVTLNWFASAGASSYNVKQSLFSGGPYTTITTVGATNHVDLAVVNGVTYYYVVSAVNDVGESSDSIEASATPQAAPANVVATGGNGQVQVTWDPFPGAASYTVGRSDVAGGPYTPVASGVAVASYLDTAVLSGRFYYYVIIAQLTGGGDSGQSLEAAGLTAPGAPNATNAGLFAATVIRVGWSFSDPVVSSFNLERSTDNMTFSTVAAPAANARAHLDGGLAPSTTYFYRLQAVNATGSSGYSMVLSNTTPAGGYNVNFANAAAAIPPGYVQDIGDYFGDRANGFFYGWTNTAGTNITVDARLRNSPLSPDLRYDTFNHMQKSPGGAAWEIEVPNGFYRVRVVGGDPTAVDSTFQYSIEGVMTPTYVPVAPAYWADFTTNASVSDGRLTILNGPSAANNKISFIDIYPEIPVLPTITGQPQDVMAEEYHPATLSAGVSGGTPPFTFLWYREGDPTPISTPGPVLTYAHVRAADAGDYQLVITNYAGSVTSMTASLTVFPDVTPPSIVSVYSLDGWTIGVCFSEEMDDSAMAITDNFSYSINDGQVGAVVPVLLRPDGKSVILRLNEQISGLFTVGPSVTMTDLAGNALGMTPLSSTVAGFFAGDIGSPGLAGLHFTCDGQDIEVVGGGADIWGALDQGYVINKSVNGDFDAKVRVTALRGANAITKAVLMVRENNNADSRTLHINLNPVPPGRDQVQVGFRSVTAGGTVGVGTNFVPVGVPNAWMRLMRFGNEFRGYRSTNGTDWVLLGGTNQNYPADALVGIALTAHDNTLLATGTFSGLTISAAVGPPSVNPAFNGSTFTAGVPTESGIAYDVKYKDSLTDPVWTFLATVNGDGTVQTYTDPGPVSPTGTRFYRIFFR